MMAHWLMAPIVLPMIGGIIQILVGYAPLKLRRILAVLTSVGILISACVLMSMSVGGDITIYQLGNWPAPFGIVLVLDHLSALMLMLTAILGICCQVYAISGTDEYSRAFHSLFLFQLMGLNIAFLTGDLFNLFVAFEVLLIASYGLVLYGPGKRRTVPGLHYVVLNLVGSAMFLIGVGLIYSVTGTLNMADLASRIPQLEGNQQALAAAGGLILMVVFGLKAAVVPLCFWLPKAYANAAAPVAALFAVMSKVGVYAIIRVYQLIFGEQAGELAGLGMEILFPAGLVTLALGVFGIVGASGMRTLVAWQVVVSVGTLLSAVSLGHPDSISAALFYLLSTTFVTAGLFLLIDMVSKQRGSVDDRIVTAPRMNYRTLLSTLYLFGAVAAVGLPPLSGFIAKLLLLKSVQTNVELAALWSVVIAGSFISVVAYSRAGSIVFWGTTDGYVHDAPQISLKEKVSTGILIGMSVAMLALAGPINAYTVAAAEQLHNPDNYRVVLEQLPVEVKR